LPIKIFINFLFPEPATYLVTPDFEFGMTQAFSGQMDGTSRSQKRNGEKALKPKTEVFWGLGRSN